MDFDEVKWALTVVNHTHLLPQHREWVELLQAHALLHQVGAVHTDLHEVCVSRIDNLEESMLRGVQAIWN
jgi:hypothetical protein